jgi:TonB family protein
MRRALGALILASALGQIPAFAKSPGSSSQAIYDLAQAAYDRSDWGPAAAGFSQLLPTGASRALGRSESVIAYRYADSLVHLGQTEAAGVWIGRAVQGLATGDPGLLAEALVVEGDVKTLDYDYPGAMGAYERAEGLVAAEGSSDALVRARFGFAVAAMTLAPKAAMAKLSLLSASLGPALSSKSMSRARLEDLEARAAINSGDAAAAFRFIKMAVADSGGLGDRVTGAQAAIRADAGVIYRLKGEFEQSRRYFAYTGAGHLPNMDWISARSGELPTCGASEEEPHPDDSVVVDLAISEDGRVLRAAPVYVSRPGLIGAAFARAVSAWRWDPEKLKDVSPFFRATLQLELKCVPRPRPTGLDAGLQRRVIAWLRQKGLVNQDGGSGASGPYLRVRADDPRLLLPGGATLAVLAAPIKPYLKTPEGFWRRLDQEKAPSGAYAEYIIRLAGGGQEWRAAARIYEAWIPRFKAQFPGDPALAYLQLSEAFSWETAGDFQRAQPLLAAVIDGPSADDALGAPIRQVALLHRAIGLDRAGDPAAARDALARSGLSAEQCSLFDTHPVAESLSIDSSAWPDDALRWRFEGYVQVAFDIADDGRVKNVRSVVSYPPYIFAEATEKAALGFRFIPPRLGGRAVGCEGRLQAVAYRLP